MGGSRARIERSAGGVVVRTVDGSTHVLLIKDPYGKWGLPKGHLEKDESAAQAAVREVCEETGLDRLELGPSLGTIDWYFRLEGDLVHKFCDYFLIGSRAGDATPEVEEGITECLWIPMERAVEQVAYDNARGIVERAVEMIAADRATDML